MAPWRYRRCPACGTVRPGGEFKPLTFSTPWRDRGVMWRRCPNCGRKGQSAAFPIEQRRPPEVA